MKSPNENANEFLLTHDPFDKVYQKYKDRRDLFIPYTAYSDTLRFARIIVKRIFEDIPKSGIKMEQFFQISRKLAEQKLDKPVKTKLSWDPIYELQLDLESHYFFKNPAR